MKRIEVDTVYRLGADVALVTYVDDKDVLWLAFSRKKRKFINKASRSTPRWYFEKHAEVLTTGATMKQVKKAATEAGCVVTADR